MESELMNRETRKSVVDFTLNALLIGAFRGALIGLPLRIMFRSPATGYFVIAYSMGYSLAQANNFLLENFKEPSLEANKQL